MMKFAALLHLLVVPAVARPAEGSDAGQTFGSAGYLASVPTNSALKSATTKASHHGLLRIGYYRPGDSPPLLYLPSRAPCTLNAGSGDGGSQVPSADGGCWIAAGMTTADVREWGVSGAVADNAPAINAAIAYAIASGINDVTLPPYGVPVSAEIDALPTSAFRVHGVAGMTGATLYLRTTAQNGFVISSESPVTLENFAIRTPGANNAATVPTAGNCISLSSVKGYNAYSRFRDLDLNGCYNGIVTGVAAFWTMEAVSVHSVVNAGIIVANSNNADVGDSSISDSYIDLNPAYNATGIVQTSAGGLKVSNTKILNTGGSGLGICIHLLPAGSTSDLLISNLSCENTNFGIFAEYMGSSLQFKNVHLVNNQFAYVKYPIYESDSGTSWLLYATVTGGGMIVSKGGVGFTLDNVADLNMIGVNIECAGGASCTGFSVGPGATGNLDLTNHASTEYSGAIPAGFVYRNNIGGAAKVNQGGVRGVTCSGALSGNAVVTNGIVTHC